MKKFAKILEVDDYQILLYTDTNVEEDAMMLHQIIQTEHGSVDLAITFGENHTATSESILEERNEAWAREWLKDELVQLSLSCIKEEE